MKIITLTLCPAFDIHCTCAEFCTGRENLLNIQSRTAGGKGINISRALHAVNIPHFDFALLGEQNAAEFIEQSKNMGLDLRSLCLKGRIRENITVHSDTGETRISFAGFEAPKSIINNVENNLPTIHHDSIITLTGRLPTGISATDMLPLIARTKAKGARWVIDSGSFSLEDLIQASAWLIKPNEQEIEQYVGKHVETLPDAVASAVLLHNQGIENVMITLGDKGAVLACDEGTFMVVPPVIHPLSTVGAGDSCIAGFLTALHHNRTKAQALKIAVAFGTAACLLEGTAPPKAEDIIEMYNKSRDL